MNVDVYADSNTLDLLCDAAKRDGKALNEYLNSIVLNAASEEYAKQQNEDAKTC